MPPTTTETPLNTSAQDVKTKIDGIIYKRIHTYIHTHKAVYFQMELLYCCYQLASGVFVYSTK